MCSSCTFLYIINELNGVNYMPPMYLKPKVLYLGSPNSKCFTFLSFCLRFEFLLDIKNRHCLFWHLSYIKLYIYIYLYLSIYIYIYIYICIGLISLISVSCMVLPKCKDLHSCLSRILSKKFRKLLWKNLNEPE